VGIPKIGRRKRYQEEPKEKEITKERLIKGQIKAKLINYNYHIDFISLIKICETSAIIGLEDLQIVFIEKQKQKKIDLAYILAKFVSYIIG
jgi:hypothetical protein